MNVSCPECSTVFRVDPAKVPAGGVRARCSTCSGVITIASTASGHSASHAASDPIGDAFAPRSHAPAPFVPQQATRTTPPQTRPAARTPAASPRVQTPVVQPGVPTPVAVPRVPTSPVNPRMTTPMMPSPALGASLPPLRTTPRTPWQPAAAIPATPPAPVSVPPFTPPSVPPVAAPYTPAANASSAAVSTPSAGDRRPINPFLARDPGLRAKRLARALVSDMVAYYPAKHSEGLEKGTLKELFRDEIKKSYDEYVAQVGSDFARTTTHFQESLNEVLGAGKKIF
jgi:predicted Zn finger-like uncharacterized protein